MNVPELQNLGLFVGRQREMDAVREGLEHAGFVTLIGPGGVGKTRLALEIAQEIESNGDVTAVWLDELRSPDDVPGAIAAALGLPSVGASDTERIVTEVSNRPGTLLIVDNAEHLVDGVREVVSRLPLDKVRLLVTSRVALDLPAERLVRLGGLPPSDAHEMLHARSKMLAVEIEDGGHEELLSALDCLPLAIELAVARMKVLSPAQILARLPGPSDVLGSQDVSRHGALDQTIAWSWELLDGDERDFLAVFGTVEHAIDPAFVEALWPDRDVWSLAQTLESKSWLQVATVDGAKRWATLRSIRRFLNRTLTEDHVEQIHRDIATWAQQNASELPGWWASFVVEGLLATEVLAGAGDYAAAAKICERCFFGAFGGPHFSSFLRTAVAILQEWPPTEAPEQWAQLAAKVSKGAFRIEASIDATYWSDLAFRHAPDHTLARLAAGSQHAICLLDAGRREEANIILDELFRERTRFPQELSLASPLLDLAISAHESGRFDVARQTCETVLALGRAADNKDAQARAWIHLSYVSYDSGDFAQAAEELAQLDHIMQDRHPHESLTMAGAVPPMVDLQMGRHEAARRSLEQREEAAKSTQYHGLEFFLNIAWSLWAGINEPEREREYLERALLLASRVASNKSTLHARLLLSLHDLKRGEFATAAKSLRKLAECRPPASPEEWHDLLDALSWFCDVRLGESTTADAPATTFGGLMAALHHAVRARDLGSLEEVIEQSPSAKWAVPGLYFMRVDDVARRLFAAMSGRGDVPRLTLQRDGRKMLFAGETTQDLTRRGPLRRILVQLAALREASPGASMTSEQIIEAGWPDEKILHDAALARVYTTMKRLRALGLDAWLLTTDEGYALDTGLLIEWADELD